VAEALEDLAVLLELQGENAFKVRAYQQAARTILSLEDDLLELAQTGRLSRIRGIGKTLAAQIGELVLTGRLEYLNQLRSSFPLGLLEMLQVPGLGPKKVRALHEQLGLTNLGQLEYACKENRLVGLKGFGTTTQANILKGLENLKKYRGRHLWAEAEKIARELSAKLGACPEIGRVEVAGSFRRLKEVVKDLDLVAVSTEPLKVVRYLENLDLVESFNGGAATKFSFRLDSGLNADLRLVSAEAFPFALHHFTGSKEHNTLMRRRAKERGLKLNEYGLFDQAGRTRAVIDEAGVFSLLDLPFIPPELREGWGEIEAAEQGALPDLVKVSDLKGLFHIHTNYSDGSMSLREVVARCRDLGYQYAGISDHSQSASYAGGLSLEALDRQFEEVEKIRADNPDFGLFWGVEADIRPDGSLDYDDEVLARFDFVIAAIHSKFSLSEKEMTDRLIRGLKNPFVTILGHPTGRLLLAREPYALDLPAVLAAAAEEGVAVEINANPHRLDLDWREMRRAKSLGLKMIICPDAHSPEGLLDARYGLNVARKGWLTPGDLLNCLDRGETARFLIERRKKLLERNSS